MKNHMKVILVAAAAGLMLTGCGTKDAEVQDEVQTPEGATVLTVGATAVPHAELLEQAKPLLAAEGIELNIMIFDDYVTPNIGLAEGSLDANFFQHQPYLDDYNAENNTTLVSVGSVHYEPFGIYGGKTTDIAALADGAMVAVPNDVSNEARALVLLEQAGLLKLKEGVGIQATVQDIIENPKNIQFQEIASEQLVRALPDVDLAVINGNYAIEGGLSLKDALVVESDQSIAAQTYANIVATRTENSTGEAVLKLIEILQGEEIQAFINNTYDGAVVPIK
jgi:D-methionine transport system substrate-binding protein